MRTGSGRADESLPSVPEIRQRLQSRQDQRAICATKVPDLAEVARLWVPLEHVSLFTAMEHDVLDL